jgi:hypothetical protein
MSYVIGVLKKKRTFVAKLGPATEFQQEAREHVAALELAIDILSKPTYEVSPFT